MRFPFARALPLSLALAFTCSAAVDARPSDYAAWMLKNLPEVPVWTAWQKETGALPPDFASLPSAPFLPDPFRFQDGRTVTMPAGWSERRAEIRRLFEQYVVGRIPPKPSIDRIVPVSEAAGEGWSSSTVRLEYGPGGKVSTLVTVTRPTAPSGARPVLIGRDWVDALVRRGYISCSYSGTVDDASELPKLYPGFDFATMAQRAWTAQVVVDYLCALPEVDRGRIAIAGYSREGKMATLAAALDERIAAVVAGSTGVGGVLPWRLSGEAGMGESIESTTRMFPSWFAPQLRFFAGHEDRLPVDANLLVALVAPRACLMQYGLTDEVSNVWANEQSYGSALRVYEALGKPGALGLLRIPGFHGSNDRELCLDWLDLQFGRRAKPWNNDLLFAWNLDAWRARNAEPFDLSRFPVVAAGTAPGSVAELERRNERVRQAVAWLLGETPPFAPPEPSPFRGRRPLPSPTAPVANPGQLAPDVPAWVIARNIQEFGWTDPERSAVQARRLSFGAGLVGDLYLPAGTPPDAKLPTVVWLHGYSYPLGYMWVYRRELHPILALAKAGYAVFAFDQCGFGSRMAEGGAFYDRTPRWSLLGRMVEDVRAATDLLQKTPNVDPERLGLLGYTLGGAVALHSAALDSRIKCTVSVAGFTPMRQDAASRPTGGLARFCVERPLAPRLSHFLGQETRLPYDYDDLLAAAAPRSVLVVQPSMDRSATPADVRAAVERARSAFVLRGAPEKLRLDEPEDYLRFSASMQERAVEWFRGNL